MLESPDSPSPSGVGKVYLVGAGPGDPGLLTRRGEAVLARADVVVYDHLASARLLDLAPRDALRICAGKSVGHCTMTQDGIQEVLIEHARAGRSVVRLKGGILWFSDAVPRRLSNSELRASRSSSFRA